MTAFAYDLETVHIADLRAPASPDTDRVFACDHSGRCEMKDVVGAVREGLLERLNERGRLGWRLAHMEIHAEVVLLVWERPETAS